MSSGHNAAVPTRARRWAAKAAAPALVLAVVVPATAGPAQAQPLSVTEVWSHTVTDGSPISLSSPDVATLNGAPAVVVGDTGGYVYAYSLATGSAVPGWPASTGGAAVDSTPSVAPLQAGSPDDSVFVGTGDAARPKLGGYEAFGPGGKRLWYVAVRNPLSDHARGASSAVIASLAVGDLQGGTDVVAPSVGQEEYALDAATGSTLRGFPWFTADSGFSTPALADLYGNGVTDIIEGGDQTAGLSYGVHYSQGGHLRVLSPTGNAGTGHPAGGLKCEDNPDQVVESSPAVGPFLAGGAQGVVVGTGVYWSGASDTDKLLAFSAHCTLAWTVQLDGATASSPALADLAGNGKLDVLEGTNDHNGNGSVYALDGATGSVIWRQAAPGEVMGGVVTADLAAGYQDVIVTGTRGAEVLDGRTGHVVAVVEKYVGLQNSALVTDDPNGTVGITVAGYNAYDHGTVEHFELRGSSGAHVDEAGSWPMFHHDPELSGNAEGTFSPVAAALH